MAFRLCGVDEAAVVVRAWRAGLYKEKMDRIRIDERRILAHSYFRHVEPAVLDLTSRRKILKCWTSQPMSMRLRRSICSHSAAGKEMRAWKIECMSEVLPLGRPYISHLEVDRHAFNFMTLT